MSGNGNGGNGNGGNGSGQGQGGGKGGPPKFNWLDPLTYRQVQRRARRSANSAFRPEMRQLNREQRALANQLKKQRRDQRYYTRWQQDRLAEWDDSQIQQKEKSLELIKALTDRKVAMWTDLRPEMIDNGQTSDVVSDASRFSGFNVQASGAFDIERLNNVGTNSALEQQATYNKDTKLRKVYTDQRTAAAMKIWSDWLAERRRIVDLKAKARDERKETYVKLLDSGIENEVKKAVSKRELALKRRELALRKYAIQVDRQNNIDDNNQSNTNNQRDNANDGDGDGGKDVDEVTLRERKKITRQYNSIMNNTLAQINSLPLFVDERLADNRLSPAGQKKMAKKILKKWGEGGMTPLLANSIVNIFMTGSIKPANKRALKMEGYIVPKNWR